METPLAAFDDLTPDLALSAVGEAFGIDPDGSFFAYPSYANRVYGLRTDDGTEYVAKFYRPGRWTTGAIQEEHDFVAELAAAEIPVVAPLCGTDGHSLQELVLEKADEDIAYPFALFPKRGGRLFDAELDDDWLRLGALAGRIHAVGAQRGFSKRVRLERGRLAAYVDELRHSGAIPGEVQPRVLQLLDEAAGLVDEMLAAIPTLPIRLHGDFHRGNVLNRGSEGLLAIDFDDASTGPAIQDLWLLLPGPASECRRELALIVEGYEGFMPFDRTTLGLVEPLRLFRMVHYIAWQARQRSDRGFRNRFEGWGTEHFWISLSIDLGDQIERVRQI